MIANKANMDIVCAYQAYQRSALLANFPPSA